MLVFLTTTLLWHFLCVRPCTKALRSRYDNDPAPLMLTWFFTVLSFPITFLVIGFGSASISMLALELFPPIDFGGALIWVVHYRAVLNFAFLAAVFGCFSVFRLLRPKSEAQDS